MQRIDYNRRCDKRFIWNPRNGECECDKLCDVGQYLDYIKIVHAKNIN